MLGVKESTAISVSELVRIDKFSPLFAMLMQALCYIDKILSVQPLHAEKMGHDNNNIIHGQQYSSNSVQNNNLNHILILQKESKEIIVSIRQYYANFVVNILMFCKNTKLKYS